MAIYLMAFLIPPIIIGYHYANSFFFNRRLTEYSSYALWTTVLRHLTHNIDKGWGVVAIAPQAEVYVSKLDEDFVDDPNMSVATRPDKEAKGVRIDLAILLHRPCRRDNSPSLAAFVTLRTASILRQLCAAFDHSLYDALSIHYTFIPLFVELKRPLSRHIPISVWLPRIVVTLQEACDQVLQQFNCTMASERYLDQKEAWLIAGTLDVFCVRWIKRAHAQAYDQVNYQTRNNEFEDMLEEWAHQDAIDRAQRAALRGASRDQPRPNRLSLAEFDTLAPPFSDDDIADYLSYLPDEERGRLSFQTTLPAHSLNDLRKTDLTRWSKPMRLGSLIADQYLSFIRNDIQAQANRVIQNWGEP
ncbi:hypothetical protein K523DRAFT_412903 [Schizophyllum commune Tattone D]|nr:hypothetical protein K523DRAFT_412903 [Schizophyllum commune Tattone D]